MAWPASLPVWTGRRNPQVLPSQGSIHPKRTWHTMTVSLRCRSRSYTTSLLRQLRCVRRIGEISDRKQRTAGLVQKPKMKNTTRTKMQNIRRFRLLVAGKRRMLCCPRWKMRLEKFTEIWWVHRTNLLTSNVATIRWRQRNFSHEKNRHRPPWTKGKTPRKNAWTLGPSGTS